MMKWVWPEIENIDDAKKVAYSGAGMAFFVSIVTGLVTYLHVAGIFRIFESLSPSAFIDAALFAIIGAGLIWKSRTVAIIAVLLYATEQYFMIKEHGSRMSIMAVIIMLAFINAVRGTFAYHRMKNAPAEEEEVVPPSVIVPEAEPEPTPRKKFSLLLIVLVFALIGVGLFFLIPILKKQNFGAGKIITQAIPSNKFKLEGILKDEQSPIAVVNGNFLKKGDVYEDNTVTEIGPDYVILEPAGDGKSLRIDLYSGDGKPS